MSIRIEKQMIEAEVIAAVECDMCRCACLPTDEPDYARLTAQWGYFSDGRDGQTWDCVLCEDCAVMVKEFIESKGGKMTIDETIA